MKDERGRVRPSVPTTVDQFIQETATTGELSVCVCVCVSMCTHSKEAPPLMKY